MKIGQTTISGHLRPSSFVENVSNPEDLVDLPGSDWIVISGMRSPSAPGLLYAARAGEPRSVTALSWHPSAEGGRIGASCFDPHGIAARALDGGRYELLVVDHGGGEAVDRLVIAFDVRGPVIVEGERHVQPRGTSGNAVAYLPDGGFVVTSMFDPDDPETIAKFARREPTGQVWRWSPTAGWSPFGTLRLSGANGIASTADGAAIFVSEWAARRVWRLASDGTPLAHVDTRFLPDNLRFTRDGRLLLAGQSARPEEVFACEARGLPTPLGFEVVVLEPSTMAVEPLIVVDHDQASETAFGGATGALQVGETVWVGSFAGRRVAVFGGPSAPATHASA